MDTSQIISVCKKFRGASESQPFGQYFIVFKVGDKIFAGLHLQKEILEIKKDQAVIPSLIEEFDFVGEAIYSNKTHWVSIKLDKTEDGGLLEHWLQESYQLVFKTLPKSR